MGQVWSKADFNGIREVGTKGGCGSVLAVTSQQVGPDNRLGTADDLLAPLNHSPVSVSIDRTPGPDCQDSLDRVRGFYSFHPGGAFFVFGDGSVRFIDQAIDSRNYQALSTIAGSEIVSDK